MTAFLWAALAAMIWGLAPLVEKAGLQGCDRVTGVFVRSIGVLVGALVFGLCWSPWKALLGLNLRTFLLLMFGGFLASILGQLAFYQALKSGPVSQVTPISGMYPLIASLLGWWLLREPFTVSRLMGVLLVVGGVVLLRR